MNDDQKAAVKAQLVALAGTANIAAIPITLIGQVASVVLAALADHYRTLR
jgi:adenylosuccinate lyase